MIILQALVSPHPVQKRRTQCSQSIHLRKTSKAPGVRTEFGSTTMSVVLCNTMQYTEILTIHVLRECTHGHAVYEFRTFAIAKFALANMCPKQTRRHEHVIQLQHNVSGMRGKCHPRIPGCTASRYMFAAT